MGEILDPKWSAVLCAVTFVGCRETSAEELRDNAGKHGIPLPLLEILISSAELSNKPLYIWQIGSVTVFDDQQKEVAGMIDARAQTFCKQGLHKGFQLLQETGSLTAIREQRTAARDDAKGRRDQQKGAARERKAGRKEADGAT